MRRVLSNKRVLCVWLMVAAIMSAAPLGRAEDAVADANMPIVLEIRHDQKDNPRNSEGCFADLGDGRIMLAYAHYYGDSWSDLADARLCARFSSDGGRKWTTQDRMLLENEGTWNVGTPSFVTLPDGTLAMFYGRTNSLADARLWMRKSADSCKTWSTPALCIPAPGYFVVNNDRVVRLSTGRLVVPAAFHRCKQEVNAASRHELSTRVSLDKVDRLKWLEQQAKEMERAWDNRGLAMFFLSDDNGTHWREAKTWWAMPIASNTGLQEPGLVELSDGRLWAWCRTDAGCQYEMFSSDKGETWTAPQPSAFKSPVSPLSMKRIPGTGELLAVWNDHGQTLPASYKESFKYSWGRTPLVAAISDDDGKTWRNRKVIESDPAYGYCYAAIHFTQDAALLCYTFGGGSSGAPLNDLRVRRVSLEWLRK